MAEEERILVTGANGFIGGWLVETLYLSGNTTVRAGIRNWMGAARLARFPLNIVLCDILNPEQITVALQGVTCVIHCAKGSDESIVTGTQNMLEASLRQSVRRFVHISTTEVYGNPSGDIDETCPCQFTGNPYGDAKIKAEELCWEYHTRGLPVTMIRPPIVYGPFSKTWTVNIALKLQSGSWGQFKEHGDGICNLIYVSDLVSAILAAAHNERAISQTFNVNGPETPTWNQYFQAFNDALGLPELKTIESVGATVRATSIEPLRAPARFARVHLERPIRRIAAKSGLVKQVLTTLERTLKTTPRMSELSLYNRKAHYLSTKAHDILGYKPQFNLKTGLELTVQWLNQVGPLDTTIHP